MISGIATFDSMVMFVFFLLAGRFVEMTVRHQGMSADDALGSMIPTSVSVLKNNKLITLPFDQIQKGDVLSVNAGDVIAIDGEVLTSCLKIDESMITGESKPITKNIGDKVMSGNLVNSGSAHIKSIAIGDETLLSSLCQLLEDAQLQKPKSLLLVDKLASWFVAIVLLLAAAMAIYYGANAPDKAMITVLAVLVATCSCALSLATPTALTAASIKLMKKGILVNNLDAIVKINKIKQWFFDKTGTLTEPYMSILNTHIMAKQSEQQGIAIMSALEHNSVHPIASAFADYYNTELKVSDYKLESGKGIQAKINQDLYKAGTKSWCDDKNPFTLDSQNTVVFLSQNNKLLAAFELENKLQKGSKNLIKTLQNQRCKVAIISGDKSTAVEAVAKELNIDNQYS